MPILVLSHLSRVCTGTGIRLMPILAQACQYQYGHICLVPVPVLLFIANDASTSTGIMTMPIPVLAFVSIVPIPVMAFYICHYWYWHFLNAYTGTDFLLPTMPIPVQAFLAMPIPVLAFLLIVPIPVRAFSLCQYWY